MNRLWSWCALVCLAGSSVSAQELERALTFLPDTINTVAVIRVSELLKSPRGQRENWGRQPQSLFLGGAMEAGADVQLIVRGMEFHPEDLRVMQTVGIVSYAKPVSLAQLAQREGGHIDKLAGKSTVHSPQQGFFVELEPRILGTMEPSYRQNVTRWIRRVAQQTEPSLSPYLLEAAKSTTAHILLALDVSEMIDPRVMRDRLSHFSGLTGDDKQRESLARLLEQLRGVRAAVTVTDRIEADVAVDFAITPSSKLAEQIRPLLSELLSRSGAMIDELDQATLRVEGKSVVLSMTLSDSSARQTLSLAFASMSGADVPVEGTTASTEDTETARTITATKNYVAAVNRLVDDLQAKNARARDYLRTASWHETYAKRIDQLPVRDVDPVALEYAAGVSSKLRALAVSLRGVPLTVNRLQNSITWSSEYTPWAVGVNIWGGIGYRPPNWRFQTNQGEIQAQQAQAIAAGEQTRYEVWKMLADDRQALRLKLREKYNIDVE